MASITLALGLLVAHAATDDPLWLDDRVHVALRATFQVRTRDSAATGFVIDDRGAFVTNAHVVDMLTNGTGKLEGCLKSHLGSEFPVGEAEILFKPSRPKISNHDVNYPAMRLPDLAILRVESSAEFECHRRMYSQHGPGEDGAKNRARLR